METQALAITLRAKKIGVLLRSARLAAGKSPEQCAQAIGASIPTIESYELGETSPSLPELEALAYYLNTPLTYFWGQEVGLANKPENVVHDPQLLFRLRNHIIGIILHQARQEAGLSQEDVADRAGIAAEEVDSYELGEQPIPLPELEVLAKAVNRPLKHFQDGHGAIGSWTRQKQALLAFADYSPELQDFISNNANRPYLELAHRLSEISRDQLRGLAEGILELPDPDGNPG